MKLSRILLILGVGANAFTILLFQGLGRMPGMEGMGTLFVLFFFPAIWLITFVLAIIAVVSFRNTALPDSAGLRVLGFFLCTPILLLSIVFGYQAMKPEEPISSMEIDIAPTVEYWYGVAYKFQWQKDFGGADYALTRYIADSIDVVARGEAAYKKDSTWIYFRGTSLDDTIRVEYYKNDSLMRSVDFSKK